MIDRWTRTPFKGVPAGYTKEGIQNWTDGRDAATSQLADWAKHTGTYLVGEGDAVNALSDPGYGQQGSGSLTRQLQLAKNGQGLLASYKPKSIGDAFETQVAKFLIGAGEGHYFGAGSWTVSATEREGVTWHEEYGLPLGRPLADATVDSNRVYTRRFAFGTNVTYNAAKNAGTIEWGTAPSV